MITLQHFEVMARIPRWRGWTKRPVTLADHILSGDHAMFMCDAGIEARRAWFMHDMHETEIVGDVPTPDKRKYMRNRYHRDCLDFDIELGRRYGLGLNWWQMASVKATDQACLIVENEFFAVKKDPTVTPYDDRFLLQSEAKLEYNRLFFHRGECSTAHLLKNLYVSLFEDDI